MKPIDDTGDSHNPKRQQDNRFPAGKLALVGLGILSGFGIVIYLSRDYAETTERYTFITDSFLNILILATIVIQALIYYVQWAAMARQGDLMKEAVDDGKKQFKFASSPRLFIEEVRAERFGVDQAAIFILKINNSGPVAAIKIPADMTIWFMGALTVSYGRDQLLNIPANGSYKHSIESNFTLSPDALEKISNDGRLLRVEGHVNHEKYCYKYNRLSKDMPELPMFIDCDLDTRRTVAAKMGSGAYVTSGGEVKLTHTRKDGTTETR